MNIIQLVYNLIDITKESCCTLICGYKFYLSTRMQVFIQQKL